MSIGNRLATLLASQLAAVAPPGFAVRVDDGAVAISHGPSPLHVDVGAIVGDSEILADDVTTASLAAISDIQDYITRVLGAPWPPADEPTRLALPYAGWSEDRLRLLYGDLDNPVLELPGITAADLGLL